IASGVRWHGARGWQPVAKNGDELPREAEIELLDDAETRYVSRGGLKLEGALAAAKVDVRGKTCLDVGQSTGGFTDCLLRHGAARVVGVDVGHGQLHASLRADPRVTCIEHANARELQAALLTAQGAPPAYDLVVGDLSFISLTLVLPRLVPLLLPAGQLLLLVKPQFELQPGQLGKGGIVRDASLHGVVEARIREACHAARLQV